MERFVIVLVEQGFFMGIKSKRKSRLKKESISRERFLMDTKNYLYKIYTPSL